MSAGYRVFTAGEGHALDEAGILSDLSAIWREASEAGGAPAMRASRANIVALILGEDRGASGAGLIDRLLPIIARQHPSRVLAVRISDRAPAGQLSASVSALCTLGENARYLCSEKIDIDASPASLASLQGVILGLALGELPLVVVVPGSVPHREQWFRDLLSHADRLLFDSRSLSDPASDLPAIAALSHGFEHVQLSDIGWIALRPWRRRIATAFDRPEARRLAAGGFDRVCFSEAPEPRTAAMSDRQSVLAGEGGSEKGTSAAGFLLRRWIAARARVREFAWEEEKGESTTRVERRGLCAIRFERAGEAPVIVPCSDRDDAAEPELAEIVTIIGGQSGYPLNPRPARRDS